MAEQKTKVVVLGGGFAGIKAALELCDNPKLSVRLISDQVNFRYYPTLYRAATGGRMEASSIPLSEIFKGKSVKLINDTIQTVDREAKKLSGKENYSYDILVVALGVVTNYFGIKGLKEYSYGIKSQEDAQELRDHIHKLLLDEGKPDVNYIVIGGGPTGVELAGALPSYIKHIMKKHQLADKKLHIDLVEAAPRLMPRMPKSYSTALAKRLRKLGIKLYLNQTVQAETADALMVNDHSIESHTVVWTAGVTNHPFFSANTFALTDHGKVVVDKTLQAEPNIFVIGDNADTPFSGMAQTALHDAKFAAYNVQRLVRGKKPMSYSPKKPIYVTPVGPRWAAVLWNNFHVYGWFGWVLRSAADFRAFHEYEPWWLSSQHWIAEYEDQPTCPICSGN
ncbi:FAD-dependent oxidoreductase [Candidatus Saccharibacteria bacterium]|nr:FAD-dependent oxidoreductase [Candidatus Saccharibacteria bacterium]